MTSAETREYNARWPTTTLLLLPLLALALLWLALPMSYPEDLRSTTNGALHSFSGANFKAAVARQARREGDSLVILEMHKGARAGEAVFSTETTLPAESFRQVQLFLEGTHPDHNVFLFWRASSAPGQLLFRELAPDADGEAWATLPATDGWEGDILELSVGVFGPTGTGPLRLHKLVLYSNINRSLAVQRALWEWRSFKPWIQSSANYYPGVRGDVLWHPAAAAAVWATLSLVLVLIWHTCAQRRRHSSPRSLLIAGLSAIMVPWLGLDLLWQGQLERQLEHNRERYYGLAQTNKHQQEDDASLQAYAARLRALLSPLRGKRLFLLNDADTQHQYHRLRMQFHLLPLNVYNYGKQLLLPGEMRPGDHVLLLAPATAVRYHPESGLLEDGEHEYRATVLDEDPQGRLFRLESPTPLIEERR